MQRWMDLHFSTMLMVVNTDLRCASCSITFKIDVDSALETGALIVVLFQQNVNGRSHGQLVYIFVFPHLPIAMHLATATVLDSNLGSSESLVASTD